MGMVLSSNHADQETEPSRLNATVPGDRDANLAGAVAKEGQGRLKDAVPHADRQSVQVLAILWDARPRIRTYGNIDKELECLNGKYPRQPALNTAVKRLRRAPEKTDLPIEIRTHDGIGYNLHAPDDWQAPWDHE